MNNNKSIAVVVLGVGEVGECAAAYLKKIPSVSSVVLADRDLAAAEKLAARLGHLFSAKSVDASKSSSVRDAIRGADYVLNCVGPYFKFARPVFDAAIAEKVAYLDINDDWEPTVDLLEQNQRAIDAGIIALVGIGASPGAANLLAKLVMAGTPDADLLLTAWREDKPSYGYSAAKEHWLHQCSGEICVWRDGQYKMEPPLQEMAIDFPGRGRILLHTVGHPEPVTLPRVYSKLKTSVNAMACPQGLADHLGRVRDAIDSGAETPESAARNFEKYVDEHDDFTSLGLPGLFALARNAHGKQSVAVLKAYPEGLGPITSAPMVAGLSVLSKRTDNISGVFSPEEFFDPATFFAEYARVAELEMPVWEMLDE